MIDRHRCFRMSAVNALDRLQSFAQGRPGIDLDRLAAALRAGSVAYASFDYQQAVDLLRECPGITATIGGPRVERLRELLSSLVLQVAPSWRWLVPLGRGFLAEHLSAEARQVFEAAGLYGPAGDSAIREWWDRLAHTIRGASDDSRVAAGRRGEELTVTYERAALNAAGRPDLLVEAVGFEDNTLGYDVRSFVIGKGDCRPKYIEVKAGADSPLRFFLTRNEWRAAERHTSDYWLHAWHLPTRTLTEISFMELSTHVPADRGRGEWEVVVCSCE